MSSLAASVDALATETGFSGVVAVHAEAEPVMAAAYGFANRVGAVPNTVDTRFGIASGTKGFTALAVMRLIERGDIALDTHARSVLGADLPLVDDAVTIEHLLAHTSGIGDYLDEEGLDSNVWPLEIPARELDSTTAYLPLLDGYPQRCAPGSDFRYCNGAYVILAVIAQRVTELPFPEIIDTFVVRPAGLRATSFLRVDDLAPDAATGYLDDGRINVEHIPAHGSGDGGIFTTVADIATLWRACFDGRVVSTATMAEMVRPRNALASGTYRYGLGFWLNGSSDVVQLEGCDAGVSFRSVHDPGAQLSATVVSNSTDGAWPIARLLDEYLATSRSGDSP